MTQHDESFYVRLPLIDGLRILADTRQAYRLFFWLTARVTREYRTPWGIRCGAVLGLAPQRDHLVAADITRCSGVRCPARTVRRWREALAALGLIVWQRTPIGLKVFVIGSQKMPDAKVEDLPAWAVTLLAGPVETYRARYFENREKCESRAEKCDSEWPELASR
jgi:hypothetical protein